ncbi:MAG: glutamate synthase subunit beta [Rhizobiales bacterium]|nr:glutamate synthase subunit beta [Hyphomicrobiales bacterium]
MGKVTGFLEIDRRARKNQTASDRIRHYREFLLPLSDQDTREQAARCMDCGIPFCHGPSGCPVHNQIPDWNDLVYNGDWEIASRNLHSTNNFPEFTGRICPAPCEEACTLNIEDSPVSIKNIEQAIADKAWENGWISPEPPSNSTGKKIAIVGSGPAGLAAAQQLTRVGHEVHIFEKNARAGGLMRYGIPDFKLEKHLVSRRIEQMEAEGTIFHYDSHIGQDIEVSDLVDGHDAVLLAGGSEYPRDLPIDGRELNGIHFAMDYLPQQNRRNAGEQLGNVEPIHAGGKHVVVIGGGDTGSDCIGTAIRQGSISVTQLEIMPMPPVKEDKDLVWPHWPLKLRTSSSQAEGADREWSVLTECFSGKNGHVEQLQCVRVDEKFKPLKGSAFDLRADLVLIAMGFVHPVYDGMIADLGAELDGRKNVQANDMDYKTSVDKVFVAGDMRRGQSLIVWAIREGRQAARAIDAWLMDGETILPR